jgi:hypothetical protein
MLLPQTLDSFQNFILKLQFVLIALISVKCNIILYTIKGIQFAYLTLCFDFNYQTFIRDIACTVSL